MQAEQYQLLPKRTTRTDGSFKKLNPIRFYTNFYEIAINGTQTKIYQFSFALPNEIQADSELYRSAIRAAKPFLQQKIGYLGHSGQMIWGSKSLTTLQTIQCQFQHQLNPYSLEASLLQTKEIYLPDLNTENTRQQYLQILNIKIKNTLRSLNLVERGKRGEYFYNKIEKFPQLQEKGLSTMKGLMVTLVQLNSGLYLQIDASSRVLQCNNLLEDFGQSPKDQITQVYTGKIVIAKYGTYRTYRIEAVDFSKSPLSTFNCNKNGKEMSFKDYYKQVYGLNVKSTKQPLLLAIKNTKKQFKKGGKQLKQINEYIYLIPEFVSITGMYQRQKNNRETMRKLAEIVKLSPTQRTKQCAGMIEKFNTVQTIIEIKRAKQLEGYLLNRPNLSFRGTTIQADNKGNIKNRGPLKQPASFTDWLFVYSDFSKRDVDDAYDAVDILKDAAKAYGIKIQEPTYVKIQSNKQNFWMQSIKKQLTKTKKCQIVVLFLNNYEQKFYSNIKKMLINVCNIPSQFILRRTLEKKSAMSSASKILIQMNIKIGSTPWQVQKSSQYFKDKNLMYGSLSISKGEKGYTLAFVGTINNQGTRVYSHCQTKLKTKENLEIKVLQDIFVNWAKSYFQNKRMVPDVILLYVEGLSLSQTKTQLSRSHIPALENMIKQIGSKTQTPNYNPELMIVVVNKKINSRFFNPTKPIQPTNKFYPELLNVDSGSIIVEAMSRQNSYDFHLAAQYVTQGTCTPTLYRVAYDTTKMPQEALINFTYEQCFNYYNWQGAIKVPACLQYADKLSKLVSMYVKEDINQSELCKKHYFL